MPKKIFDIVPPKRVAQKNARSVPEGSLRIEEIPETGKSFKKKKSFSRFLLKLIVVLCLVSVPIGILTLRSKLILTLQPVQEKIEFEEEIEVNISQTAMDFQKKIIPGKLFETEKEKWEVFQSTGKDFEGGKAQGVIKVYNTHTPPTPITLIATTRFLSSQDGKTFRAPEKIYLPPAEIKNGKVIPGSKEVQVEAQEMGEEYNIGPSKFSVPALAGTALYYNIWAESTAPMESGFKREIKKITSEDLESAKNALKKKLEDLARNSLKSEVSRDFTLEDEAIFEEEPQVSCFQEAGTKVSEFSCQGRIKAVGLGFKTVDLKEFAIQFILSKIPSSKKLYHQSLNLSFFPKKLLREEERMILNLKMGGEIYEELNQDIFLSQIQGKSQEQIKKIIFEDYPQIENAEFKFWPFWIQKAPKTLERIEIGWKF